MNRLATLAILLAAASACGPDDGAAKADASSGGGGDASTAADAASTGDAATGSDGGDRADAGIEGCNPQNFTLQQGPAPEVYLVVDRSGSMNDPGATPPNSRWDELNAAVDAALAQFESTIAFGLLMYPSGGECSTSGPQVGVATDNHAAITFALSNTLPAGGTPTAAALNNAAASLTALGDPQAPKFIILATDGGPNCNYFLQAQPACSCTYASSSPYCCTSYPSGACVYGNQCLDDTRTVDVIGALRSDHGIDTFVIGLSGTDEYVSLLDQMAIAGGRPQGGATEYYAASNQAELASALQQIAGATISCTLDLGQAPDNPAGVRVYLDGVEVSRDTTKSSGWDYTDGSFTQIELHGEACSTLQDGAEHTITATFPCVVE